MVNFRNISDISLDQNEYCVLDGVQNAYNSHFNIKIPKLMTSVTSDMNDPFNRNILVNANECKPTIATSLYVQNHISVPRSSQCSLSDKIIDKYNNIPDGLGVICLCMNGNYRDMKIIDYI